MRVARKRREWGMWNLASTQRTRNVRDGEPEEEDRLTINKIKIPRMRALDMTIHCTLGKSPQGTKGPL